MENLPEGFKFMERGDPAKMWVIIGQQRWLEGHADCRNSEWFCKASGEKILMKEIGRSIWFFIMRGGGGGEVRKVTHFWCPACENEPGIPYGTPIYDMELTGLEVYHEIVC